MPDEQFKRNIAYKFRIGNIIGGNPLIENERFVSLDLDGKKVVRVNVVGSIVDKYESGGEKKFLSLTLDDGSEQIKLKSFGDDFSRFSWVSQGQTVVVIGVLRYYNNEIYISPEIIKEADPRYLLIRKLELEKEAKPIPKAEKSLSSVKDRIIDLIKNAETTGGINLDKIIISLNGSPPESINGEIQKLLEEGIIFEPRPGIVRWLG